MKNKLVDLNNHLFEQLERLNDEDLKGDKLKTELSRARTVASIASGIVENAKTILDAQKFMYNSMKEIPGQMFAAEKELPYKKVEQ